MRRPPSITSTMRRNGAAIAVALAVALSAPGGLLQPPPARAGLGGTACNLLGTFGEGWWGKACNTVLDVGGKLAGIGKRAGGVISKLSGNGLVQRAAGIAAIVAWVLGGARWTIDHLGAAISSSTTPQLTAHWFVSVYLRIEGLAVFFTLLFVIAAAAEAVLRGEVSVLARALLIQLPLAALATAVAAPVTMLLLAATDQLSSGIAAVAGNGSTHFLTGAGAWVAAGLTAADPFFAVLAGGLVVAAGGALWIELLIREVAVYVVVGMLPVAFAALVWPARRVWAIRAVEVLVALILAKVGIVAVLALGGAALANAGLGSLSRLLGGLSLILLGAFTPWLLLRLIPLGEVAAAAVGHVRGHVHSTAGLRTPEAALAGRAAGRWTGGTAAGVRGTRRSAPPDAADGIAVSELLEQMQRRSQTVQNGHGPAMPAPGGSQREMIEGNGDPVEPEFPPPAQLKLGVDRTPVDQPPIVDRSGNYDAPSGRGRQALRPASDGEQLDSPSDTRLPASPPPDPGQPPLGGDPGGTET